MAYDQPIITTLVAAANASLSVAADVFMVQGPPGKRGKVLHVSMVMTTENTTAAAGLDFGTQADTDAYGTISTAAAQADESAVVATAAQCDAIGDTNNVIPADTILLISGDGAGTNGAADITVVIGWF